MFYPVSNESGEEEILDTLHESSQHSTCYYLGVSGLQNQNYLAAIATANKKPKKLKAVLLDINGTTCQFHQLIRRNLQMCNSKESFCLAMESELLPNGSLETNQKFCREIFRQRMPYWLTTDEKFVAVRKLFNEDQVAIMHQNLADPETRQRLHSIRKKISIAYTSNVQEWLQDNYTILRSFDENIRTFLSSKAVVISSAETEKSLHLTMSPYRQSKFLDPSYSWQDYAFGEHVAVAGKAIPTWPHVDTEYIPTWLR
jgi:hypothetical protein